MKREDNEELFQRIEERQRRWIKRHRWESALNSIRNRSKITNVRFMYLTRNYVVDGFLPIVLALITILGHINLAWIQAYLPSFKALSTSR